MTQTVFGADNGYSGWMVFLNTETGKIEHLEQYPRNNEKRLYELFSQYKPVLSITEQPFMAGGFRGVASSNFEILGRYKQTWDILELPYETAYARSWRAYLGLKAKGREAQKEASIAYAKTIFDNTDTQKMTVKYNKIIDHHRTEVTAIDDNIAESAIIAYYALQRYKENK